MAHAAFVASPPGHIPSMPYITTGVPSRSDDCSPSRRCPVPRALTSASEVPPAIHDARTTAALIQPNYLRLAHYFGTLDSTATSAPRHPHLLPPPSTTSAYAQPHPIHSTRCGRGASPPSSLSSSTCYHPPPHLPPNTSTRRKDDERSVGVPQLSKPTSLCKSSTALTRASPLRLLYDNLARTLSITYLGITSERAFYAWRYASLPIERTRASDVGVHSPSPFSLTEHCILVPHRGDAGAARAPSESQLEQVVDGEMLSPTAMSNRRGWKDEQVERKMFAEYSRDGHGCYTLMLGVFPNADAAPPHPERLCLPHSSSSPPMRCMRASPSPRRRWVRCEEQLGDAHHRVEARLVTHVPLSLFSSRSYSRSSSLFSILRRIRAVDFASASVVRGPGRLAHGGHKEADEHVQERDGGKKDGRDSGRGCGRGIREAGLAPRRCWVCAFPHPESSPAPASSTSSSLVALDGGAARMCAMPVRVQATHPLIVSHAAPEVRRRRLFMSRRALRTASLSLPRGVHASEGPMWGALSALRRTHPRAPVYDANPTPPPRTRADDPPRAYVRPREAAGVAAPSKTTGTREASDSLPAPSPPALGVVPHRKNAAAADAKGLLVEGPRAGEEAEFD
ncbi:hypothetical protein B0H14DRAFT_3903077 [Mycena olivaceomarginata]|nr:hypothetical protein B0H14DRAFT_3903077 [Mycena olivaceomarginata]